MSNPYTDQRITVKLRDLLDLILKFGTLESQAIPSHIADLIVALTKNHPQSGYHLQIKDEFGVELDNPVLWQYSFWADDQKRRAIAKKRSQDERDARNVFEANVKLIERYVQSVLLVDGDAGRAIAYSLLANKKFQQIRGLGVTKLYKTIDEIP